MSGAKQCYLKSAKNQNEVSGDKVNPVCSRRWQSLILSVDWKPKDFSIRCYEHAKTGNYLSKHYMPMGDWPDFWGMYIYLNAMELLKWHHILWNHRFQDSSRSALVFIVKVNPSSNELARLLCMSASVVLSLFSWPRENSGQAHLWMAC